LIALGNMELSNMGKKENEGYYRRYVKKFCYMTECCSRNERELVQKPCNKND
jgi:hypothetical protein